jgi:hypothetical protein
MRLLNKLTASVLGLMSYLVPFLGQLNSTQGSPVSKPAPENQPERARFTKEDLISALQKLNLNAKEIRIVSAMCYDMSEVLGDIDFHCALCGRTTSYKMNSHEGNQVTLLAFIQRSFASLPYKASIDASGLCSVCGKDKDKILSIHIACFECGKDIAWDLRSPQDIKMLQWLYLKPPFTELDGANLGINGNGEEKAEQVRKGIAYIRDHVFCPLHREKILGNVQK